MNRNYFGTFFTLILTLSVFVGNLPSAAGQTVFRADTSFRGQTRDAAYASGFRNMRGQAFANMLAQTMTPAEVESVQNWLDLNNAHFFRTLDTAFQNAAEQDAVTRLKLKGAQPALTPSVAPAKLKKARSYGRSENMLFGSPDYGQLFGFNEMALADDIVVTKIVTDDGIETKGSSEKTKGVGGVIVTQGQVGSSRHVTVSGGNVGIEYNGTEYIEYENKATRHRSRDEITVRYRVMLASCPDADGISAGNGTASSSFKKTITTPQTIAIITRELTTRMEIRGIVNDAAELTHFDMKGGAVLSTTGADRARRLGLLEGSDYEDGSKEIAYETVNNKLGKQVKNADGFTETVGEEIGDHQGTFPNSTTRAEAEFIDKMARGQVQMIHQNALMYYKLAETHWQGGGCVKVTLTAPKKALRYGEQIDVTAETTHVHEKIKLNADLESTARAEATPDKVRGTPQSTFTLTAPASGDYGAMLIVTSTSKRGRSSEMLNFHQEKPTKGPKQPVEVTPKRCYGAWSGKITAVKTNRKEIIKPPDGRLVRQIETEDEAFSIDYYVLGIPDTTQGFTNAYFSDAQMNYRAAKYSESNYAPGKMSCGGSIITTPQTKKFESLTTGLSAKRITVYVSTHGEKGILTFGSPDVGAERIITRTYESACPPYNQTNSGVDRSANLIEVSGPGFEVEFELGPKSYQQIEGSKTVENSDGSQTVVTWNLKRGCK